MFLIFRADSLFVEAILFAHLSFNISSNPWQLVLRHGQFLWNVLRNTFNYSILNAFQLCSTEFSHGFDAKNSADDFAINSFTPLKFAFLYR